MVELRITNLWKAPTAPQMKIIFYHNIQNAKFSNIACQINSLFLLQAESRGKTWKSIRREIESSIYVSTVRFLVEFLTNTRGWEEWVSSLFKGSAIIHVRVPNYSISLYIILTSWTGAATCSDPKQGKLCRTYFQLRYDIGGGPSYSIDLREKELTPRPLLKGLVITKNNYNMLSYSPLVLPPLHTPAQS